MKENNKQLVIDMAVIKTQQDAMFKKQDELTDLMKDGFNGIKESYTRQVARLEIDMARTRNDQRELCEERKKMIDNHCGRIRKNTTAIEKLKGGQEVNKTKLGGLILIITTIFTIIAQFIGNAVSGKS